MLVKAATGNISILKPKLTPPFRFTRKIFPFEHYEVSFVNHNYLLNYLENNKKSCEDLTVSQESLVIIIVL
jgi:hypothetical protein